MPDLTSQLIVRLIDGVSGPAKQAGRALHELVAGTTGRLDKALARNRAALDDARAGMFDAAAGAYALYSALSSPIKAATEFQAMLTDIGQKANLSDEAMKGLGNSIKRMSQELGQSTSELAKATDSLMGRGLDAARALEILPAIAKTAAAYRSTIDDVGKAGFALIDNLGVPANELGRALDGLAVAGKAGSFELADMAREFPGLTAAAAALGITGTRGVASLAAMLQVAKTGAGSSAEAANNVANLMQKVVSPDAVKRFEEFGIDIRAEMARTAKEGGDLFEKIAELVDRATSGDASKISDLFQDAQVQRALIPLMANLEELRRVRNEALAADGTVERDFARRMETTASAMQRFSASIERMQIALGSALLPAMNSVLDRLGPLVDAFTGFISANAELVAGIAATGTAFVGLSIGLATARYAFLVFQRGALLAIRSVAVALGPVGIALAGVAAAGMWISSNWRGLTELVGGFVSAIRDQFPSLGPVFETLGGWINTVVGFVQSLVGPVQMTTAEWRALGAAMGQSVAQLANDVASLPGKIVAVFAALPGQLLDIGRQAINALWEGMKAGFDAMIEGVKARVSQIASAIASLGIGGQQPAGMPAAGKSFGRGPQPPERKATGGPVEAGGTYLVGEKGPEVFRPNVAGSIVPNHAVRGSTSVSIPVSIVINAQDSLEGARRAASYLRDELQRSLRAVQGDVGFSLA